MQIAVIAKARNGPMISYRQKFNLNQTEAAKLAGVSLGTWLRLEGLKFNKLSVKSIDKIADAIGVHSNVVAPPEIRGDHLKWAETAFVDIDSRYLLSHIGNPQLLSHQVDIPAEEIVQTEELKQKIDSVLMTLTFRQREVLKQLFGIDCDILSVREVAEVFKLSYQRIRDIKATAMRKLQHPVRVGKIKGFLENLEE